MPVFPDSSTAFGASVHQRLRDEQVIWLTTVAADGTPQPNPVWFVVEGETLLVYNRPDARRLAHIRREPRVALNLDSDGRGGGIVVLTGSAAVVEDVPPVFEHQVYLEKYRAAAASISGDVESFAKEYSVAIRVTVDRVRGF